MYMYRVEPLNNGHSGDRILVHCREVVPILEVMPVGGKQFVHSTEFIGFSECPLSEFPLYTLYRLLVLCVIVCVCDVVVALHVVIHPDSCILLFYMQCCLLSCCMCCLLSCKYLHALHVVIHPDSCILLFYMQCCLLSCCMCCLLSCKYLHALHVVIHPDSM